MKWKAVYKNLNLHFMFFDNILQIEKGELVLMTDNVPTYLEHRLPDIFKLTPK